MGEGGFDDEGMLRDGGDKMPMHDSGAPKNPFLWSMRVLFLIGFLALFDLTIIIPTSASYFGKLLWPNETVEQVTDDTEQAKLSNFYFSISLSAFSLAQAIIGIFGGFIIRHLGFKKTFIILCSFTIVGDTLYALGINYVVAIIGRTLAGIGSANLGMVFTYIAVVTSGSNERNHNMSVARLCSTIGLVFSPGIVALLQYIDISIGDYKINQLNCSGWIVSLIALTCIILIVVVVKEPPKRGPPGPPKVEQESLLENMGDSNEPEEPPPKKPAAPKLYMSKEVIVIFIFSFYNGFTGTSFEFVTAPITSSKYGLGATQLSLYMLGGSVVSIMVIIAVMKLTPTWRIVVRIGERFWMMFAFISFVVGIIICYIGSQGRFDISPSVFGEWVFMIGQTICMSAYMMLSVSLMPLSSKIVPPHAKEMMMPWVNSCLALGRLTGPLWTNFTYAAQNNQSTEIMFGSIFGLLAVCILLLVVFWRRMVADVWKMHGGSYRNFASI